MPIHPNTQRSTPADTTPIGTVGSIDNRVAASRVIASQVGRVVRLEVRCDHRDQHSASSHTAARPVLEEGGLIDRYVALLNPAKVGRGFTPFVRVWLRGQEEDTSNHFINGIKSFPEILECHLMAGDCDFLLRVTVADLDAYRQFQIRHLNRIAGVQNTMTEIQMQRIKQTTELPL